MSSSHNLDNYYNLVEGDEIHIVRHAGDRLIRSINFSINFPAQEPRDQFRGRLVAMDQVHTGKRSRIWPAQDDEAHQFPPRLRGHRLRQSMEPRDEGHHVCWLENAASPAPTR